MTCIMAIETSDNNVVMGGDKLGSNGFTKTIFTVPKIFKHSGMMFGYTSTFRFGQIIECVLDDNKMYPPTPDGENDTTYKWLVRVFIPKLKSTLKSEDYSNGGNAIIVINNQVWELQNDFSVLRAAGGISSVGSCEFHAISSLMTQVLNNDGNLPTTEQAIAFVKTAFTVVGTCVTSVSEQHDIIQFND